MGQNLVTEFGRILKTNTEEFLKGAVEASPHTSILVGQLKKRGHIRTNCGGIDENWKVRKGRHGLTKITEAQAFALTRTNLYDEAKLSFSAGYRVGDAITERELLLQKNDQTRLVEVWGNMLNQLKDDFLTGFNAKLYQNGETTTYVDEVHGLETMFQISTATVPTGVSGSPIPAIGVYGSLTYAGIALTANYTPTGGSANYYWKPNIIVDATSGAFGAGGWLSTNADKIFDRGCQEHSFKNNSKFPQVGITSKTWYNLLRLAFLAKESIVINRPGNFAEQTDDFGFQNVQLNGVPVYCEPDDWPTMKTGHGAQGMYLLNLDKMYLDFLGDWFNVHIDEDPLAGLVKTLVVTCYPRLRTESPIFQTKIFDKA